MHVYISSFFLGRPALLAKIVCFLLKVHSSLTDMRASPTPPPAPPPAPPSLMSDESCHSIQITTLTEIVSLSSLIENHYSQFLNRPMSKSHSILPNRGSYAVCQWTKLSLRIPIGIEYSQ